MLHSDTDQQHSILVVDDFDDTRQMIVTQLRYESYRVIEVKNGRDAIEMMKSDCPDLVLMDLSLPVLDGLSAAYRIARLEATCSVPIIACSAHSADTHRAAALAVGCKEYINKPFDIEKLKEMIRRLLSERDGEDKSNTAGRQAADAKAMNDDELLEYIDGLLQKKDG
ncbi:MAG TPA: response regulator [Pyrinomonadaceae bacterium]|nr:response regulator [Pyrinomonadaceae bacterium]